MLTTATKIQASSPLPENVFTGISNSDLSIRKIANAQFPMQTNEQQNLELISYLANKAIKNQKPNSTEIKILKAANEATKSTRACFNHKRVNVHASQAESELVENANKFERVSEYRHKDFYLRDLNSAFYAARAELAKVGSCVEFSHVGLMHFINRPELKEIRELQSIHRAAKDENFIWSRPHTTNLISYEDKDFIYNVELNPKPHWETRERLRSKHIVMDTWCYGPPVLEEDYTYKHALPTTLQNNWFILNDENSHQKAKEYVDKCSRNKELIKQDKNIKNWLSDDERPNDPPFPDFGVRYSADRELFQPPTTSLQKEICFVVAAKEITSCSTKEAVNLFKKHKKINF